MREHKNRVKTGRNLGTSINYARIFAQTQAVVDFNIYGLRKEEKCAA